MLSSTDVHVVYMFRFNPALETNRFTLDSKEPTGDYQAFITGEARYTRLAQAFPERAKALFEKAEATAKAKYERLNITPPKLRYNQDNRPAYCTE